jgi:hypothetical protein
MHELTLRIDDRTLEWIERNRGDMSVEEYAAYTIGEHRSGATTAAASARLHERIIGRLDELERRIERLHEALRLEEARIHSR